jgi:hypothetical protein
MKHWKGLVLSGLLASLVGCASSPSSAPVVNETLTAEDAKNALLEMFEYPDEQEMDWGFLDFLSQDLEKKPITVVNADEIEIGRWEINLRQKTFRAALFFPKAHRHSHNRWKGLFQRRGTDGKWQAKLTESASGG